MKIALLAPIWHNIPPPTYGGTEDVVYNLANGLVARDHEVTLFGPGTADVAAKLHPTIQSPLRDMQVDWTNVGYTVMHITQAFDHADEFDILHVHLNKTQDHIALPLALSLKKPVLFTIHYQIPTPDEERRHDRYLLLQKYQALPYTSISDSQRDGIQINFIATVYNGVDLKRFPFSNKQGRYLAWLGKVTPFKGTKEAILAAKKAGMKLYVMGTVEKAVSDWLAYYEKEIKPLLNDKQIVWVGEVSHQEKASILSGAKALLNPIQWEEPFGLVMAEALACGTPVIAYRRGAAGEIISDGKTGFLVDSLDEMVEKVTEVEHIIRSHCRDRVDQQFSVEKMVEGYEGAYETVVENWEEYKEKQEKLLNKQITQ